MPFNVIVSQYFCFVWSDSAGESYICGYDDQFNPLYAQINTVNIELYKGCPSYADVYTTNTNISFDVVNDCGPFTVTIQSSSFSVSENYTLYDQCNNINCSVITSVSPVDPVFPPECPC